MNTSKVMVFGECMLELSQAGGNLLAKSFAGDVYNTAVYMKRVAPEIEVHFLTAVGIDKLSDELLSVLDDEGVKTDFVYRHPDKNLGSYMVHLDDDGERSFTYWRSDSAAKRTLDLLEGDFVSAIKDVDYFFYSGISLAILPEESREKLWQLLEDMRAAGVKVVFDPNYRPKLWVGCEDVPSAFEKAFSLCDVLLPGIEDFDWLFGLKDIDAISGFLDKYEIPKVIVKNGPNMVTSLTQGAEKEEIQITPVTNVVDTTSAGDAFNGAYLASDLAGNTIAQSVKAGAVVAGEVIQHKGAIVPKDLFNSFLASR